MPFQAIFHKSKLFWIFLFVSTIVSFSISTWIYFSPLFPKTNNNANQINVLSTITIPTITPQTAKDIKSLGMLVLGYGGPGHEGSFLTDAIQVVYVDFDKGKIALISIPRDVWTKLPNGNQGKINSALVNSDNNNSTESKKDPYQIVYRGADGVKSLISQITGLPINYFIAVDFVGLQRAIGKELGDIEVEVSQTLDDPWYPVQGRELELCGLTSQEIAEAHQKYSGFELEKQFPCRFEHVVYKKGVVSMQGADVLKYVRSRHGSGGGDFSRGKRQQEILMAIKNKLLSLGFLDNMPNFFKQITTYVQTDIDVKILENLVPSLKKGKDFQIVNINLSTENVLTESKSSSGAFILIPKQGTDNWSDVRSFIAEQIH